MNIKPISSLVSTTKAASKTISNNSVNFEKLPISVNKKALKGISLAALLGMTAVLNSGCSQSANPILPTQPKTIEQPLDTTNIITDPVDSTNIDTNLVDTSKIITDPVDSTNIDTNLVDTSKTITNPIDSTNIGTDPVDTSKTITDPIDSTKLEQNITKTERSLIFEASKQMFEVLGINTITQKATLKEGCYTPHSGDILSLEFALNPGMKQRYELNIEKSTPEKLVYSNSSIMQSDTSYKYTFDSSFEINKNGEIIRKDNLTPGVYYKYTLMEDNSVKVNEMNAENDLINYRNTYFYQAGTDSTRLIKSDRYFVSMYSDAILTVAE